MREFRSTKFRLIHAPLWQKRLYTAFLGFMLIGLGTNFLFGMTRTGFTVRSIADYYRGNPERMMFEKSLQHLLEVTHMHAFVMPIILLVLGHLFFLTDWSSMGKRIVASTAVLAVFLDILSPWAVRYLDPGWAFVKWFAGYALGISFLCMIGVPFYEMWLHKDVQKGGKHV